MWLTTAPRETWSTLMPCGHACGSLVIYHIYLMDESESSFNLKHRNLEILQEEKQRNTSWRKEGLQGFRDFNNENKVETVDHGRRGAYGGSDLLRKPADKSDGGRNCTSFPNLFHILASITIALLALYFWYIE
nr:uncharacterized protein LOC109173094 [Ipomoea batatas]